MKGAGTQHSISGASCPSALPALTGLYLCSPASTLLAPIHKQVVAGAFEKITELSWTRGLEEKQFL